MRRHPRTLGADGPFDDLDDDLLALLQHVFYLRRRPLHAARLPALRARVAARSAPVASSPTALGTIDRRDTPGWCRLALW